MKGVVALNVTRKQIVRCTEPGDTIFVLDDDGNVVEAVVIRHEKKCMVTTRGEIPYEDHGWLYWLTRAMAGVEVDRVGA